MVSNNFYIYFVNIILLIFILFWFKNHVYSDLVLSENDEIVLTTKYNIFINKYVYKVETAVDTKWLFYKNLLNLKIDNKINNWDESPKSIAILKEVSSRVSLIWTDPNLEEYDENNDINVILDETEYSEEKINTYSLENIDLNKVKEKWLWLYNNVRTNLWLAHYNYNPDLEKTALEWSKTMKSKWVVDHRRNAWDSYYNYNKIVSWFSNRWISCKNVNWITVTENIWRGQYKCNDWECSDELSDAIKWTFDFYMAEKNKSYKPHYQSIVNKNFKSIWLWIELSKINTSSYKYYLTVHYCTELK